MITDFIPRAGHRLWPCLVMIAWLVPGRVLAQDDLMDLFGQDEETLEYVQATFKTTRLVNGQSIESPAEGNLLFLVSHRFGRINQGAYEFFGLDQSTIRLGFEYGITDRLNLGIGRSSFQKTLDGFLKYKILRQSTGTRNMPLSISFFGSYAVNGLRWEDPERSNYFSSRMAYTFQLLMARKFTERISLQLMPTLVHKNLVPLAMDENDVYSMGAGGRIKLGKRVTLNAEYYYLLSPETAKQFENPLAVGVDIETGGHVFQLHVSNAQPMFERAFITETTGKFFKGDIYFGFGISRIFTLKKKSPPE